MKAQLQVNGQLCAVDLAAPLDISIPLRQGAANVNAFHLSAPRFEPVRAGSFVGSVADGGPCNCEDLLVNAHGNGTHTECVGHITAERITINECLTRFFFIADLLTLDPIRRADGDRLIMPKQLSAYLAGRTSQALILRTLPNSDAKRSRHYSGTNPVYLDSRTATAIREAGIKHLLVDFPSVDREEDGGELLAHHAFWNLPGVPRRDATISEMIYVPDTISDGRYLLSFQIMSVESDASPSKPVLYELFAA